MKREYPSRPIVGVGAVIWRSEELLLIRQDKYPDLPKDFWTLPGGAQKLGETVEEALHREIREETRLEVKIGPLIAVTNAIFPDKEGRIRYHYTVLNFRCEWVSGQAYPASDAIEVRWVSIGELDSFKTWKETKRLIIKSAGITEGSSLLLKIGR
jgi:ADP-ribose pyrophosphatase YjhB (NUDIX family)